MNKSLILCTLAVLSFSCKQDPSNQENQQELTTTDTIATPMESENSTGVTAGVFDLNSLPFATADVGDFPFINLPKGLEAMNKPLERKFDVCYFPIDGVMTAVEGKLYKVNVTNAKGETYSQRYFEKSMADYLKSIGASLIYDGEISKESYANYAKEDPNKGGEGDIGYPGENIHFYLIKTKDKGNIYIQYTSNNAGGKLNVLQEEAFVQTVTKVNAAKISQDLTTNGKIDLYINFDLNKATITADGKKIVDEIAKSMKEDSNLKLSIEGHTDNTGNSKDNLLLSEKRAQSVLTNLIQQGIDKTRLSSKGWGDQHPLASNDNEADKAKNRRVSLVKTN